jgi:hypothetical protein
VQSERSSLDDTDVAMICPELSHTMRPRRIDISRYTHLHPAGQRLIIGWFKRAWQARDSQAEDCFEAFIFAWFAVNGWAACVADIDQDRAYLDALMHDQAIRSQFAQLLAVSDSAFAASAREFAQQWPIFEVKSLRQRGILQLDSGERRAAISRYFAAGATRFEPQCWKRHVDAGAQVPLDWPHTLTALYRVRCNLFHGEKAAHSEMDQRVVSVAFRTLVHFFRTAGYL